MTHALYQAGFQLIDQSGLDRIAPMLKSNLTYAIAIESNPAQDYSFLRGASKIGGTPDLPADLEWPHWQGEPMIFLAQINLSDVVTYDLDHRLPSHGALAFFCKSQDFMVGWDSKGWAYVDEPGEPGSTKVYFFEGSPNTLQLCPLPDVLEQKDYILEPCTLQFHTTVTLPDLDSLLIESLKLDDDDFYRYMALSEAFRDHYGPTDNINHYHQLLGHPYLMQPDMELSCQLATVNVDHTRFSFLDESTKSKILADASNWTLLFKIDTDEYAKVSWGEAGSLNFWIKREDLEQRNFSHCLAISDSL